MPQENKIKLQTALKCFGVKTIRIHQINFLMMYFPVYMLLENLMSKDVLDFIRNEIVDKPDKTRKQNKEPKLFRGDENGITVKFINYDSDDDIIQKMLEIKDSLPVEEKQRDDSNDTLDLFLCEPVLFHSRKDESEKLKSCKTKYDPSFAEMINGSGNIGNISSRYVKVTNVSSQINNCKLDTEENSENSVHVLHVPFINFPPLFGIARENDPVINVIKKRQEKEMIGEIGKPQMLHKSDYWKHFSAKMSLLSKKELEQLVVSIYPKGSTTDWMIRKRKEQGSPFIFKGKTWIEINKEFDDLLNGHVNVAFTVQPWMVVQAAKSPQKPLDIEIVFKNRSVNYDCTSLMFVSCDKSKLILGNYLLNLLYFMIHEKIIELYEHVPDRIEEYLQVYCYLKRQSCGHISEVSCSFNRDRQDDCSDNCAGSLCSCECCHCVLSGKSHTGEKHGCIFVNRIALELLADSQIYKHKESFFASDNKDEDFIYIQMTYFKNKFNSIKLDKVGFDLIRKIATTLQSPDIISKDFDTGLIVNSLRFYKDKYKDSLCTTILSNVNTSALISSLIGVGSYFDDINHTVYSTTVIDKCKPSVLDEVNLVVKTCLNYNTQLAIDQNKLFDYDKTTRAAYRKNFFTTRKVTESNIIVSNIDNVISNINTKCDVNITCEYIDELCIPHSLIEQFIEPVIAGSQEPNRASKNISLCSYQLKCQPNNLASCTLRRGYKSLYFLTIEMEDKNWKFGGKKPNPFNNNNMIYKAKLLFDYIIIAPDCSNYKLLESNTLNKDTPDWIDFNGKLSLNIRQYLSVGMQLVNNTIEISYNNNVVPININKDKTYHLLVFDNTCPS